MVRGVLCGMLCVKFDQCTYRCLLLQPVLIYVFVWGACVWACTCACVNVYIGGRGGKYYVCGWVGATVACGWVRVCARVRVRCVCVRVV